MLTNGKCSKGLAEREALQAGTAEKCAQLKAGACEICIPFRPGA